MFVNVKTVGTDGIAPVPESPLAIRYGAALSGRTYYLVLWVWEESNLRPPLYQSGVLTTELHTQKFKFVWRTGQNRVLPMPPNFSKIGRASLIYNERELHALFFLRQT